MSQQIAPALILAAALLTACSDSNEPNPGPNLSCAQVIPTTLAPGEARAFDPTVVTACVAVPSVPAAGSAGAEYLYLAAGTAGQEVSPAKAAQYAIQGGSAPAGVAANQVPLPSPLESAFKPQLTATQFHAMLRQRERMLSTDPNTLAFRSARVQAASVPPPQVGDTMHFLVCRNSNCQEPFVNVFAIAQHVGAKVAIFVDTAAPKAANGGYDTTDLGNVGTLFDNFLYPIDTTNFGRETDIDGNGVVYVLLSPKVNQLSGNCSSTGSVILGFFFSADLVPGSTGSNGAEIFYSIVPDPNNLSCTITKRFALDVLPPTFIHEFQHMISYGQHFVLRKGPSEDNWLNEGLSHYAEELGGRLIPDCPTNPTVCQPALSPNSLTQFAFTDYDVSYKYLTNPEGLALPQTDDGIASLQGGPNFLMVHWLSGQFGTTTPNPGQFLVKGTDFTRKLEATTLVGSANVSQQSGQPFDSLVVYWQLANYLASRSDFTSTNPRLSYQDINLASIFSQLHQGNPSTYPRVYPLVPDIDSTGPYQRNGTLLQATGHHVRIIQAPGAAGVNMLLTGPGGVAISSDIIPRIGLVRIR